MTDNAREYPSQKGCSLQGAGSDVVSHNQSLQLVPPEGAILSRGRRSRVAVYAWQGPAAFAMYRLRGNRVEVEFRPCSDCDVAINAFRGGPSCRFALTD